ncbi:S-adenosylmethionine:tRNA ribosyltransferase-isomerase, partial [Streptobacillus moniliformis]
MRQSEERIVPEKSAETINQGKNDGKRSIAVGTTSNRTLESPHVHNNN